MTNNNDSLQLSRASAPPALASPEQGGHYGYVGQAGVPVREHLRTLRKYLGLIIGVTALVTGAVSVYMMRQPNIYAAQARVQVNLETFNPVLGANKENSVIVSNPVSDPTYFNTQLQLLTSPELLQQVVRTLQLDRKKGEPQPSPEATPDAERLSPYVEALQTNLLVKQVKETRLIDVTYTHSDPQFAASVTNALVKAFVDANLDSKTEAQAASGEFLTKRIAELQAKIRDGEAQLVSYARNIEGLSPDAGQNQNTVVERLLGLNRQLVEIENTRKEAEAAYQAMNRPGTAELLAQKDTHLTEGLESRLGELQQRRAALQVKFTDAYPEVISVNEQIDLVNKQIAAARQKYLTTIKGEAEIRYKQALAREQSLRADFEAQRRATSTQNASSINYRILQQEIETYKKLLDGLLQRSRENEIARAGTSNNIRINYLATAPKKPIGPHRAFTITLAFCAGLLFSIGLAFGLGYLDDSLQTSHEVERALHLPALAAIPAVGKRWGGSNATLLLHDNVPPALGEAYKQLRTSVLLSKAGRAPRSLLVTSSVPSEGKTTTSVNVALSLAQTGAKVLVIDADMRRPRLHSIFAAPNDAGLSSLLSSEMSSGKIAAALHLDIASGLYILTSGPIPPNPAELLGSEQMGYLLEQLTDCFTHVVIDSPPVASFTDSALLGTLTDGVLLVVQSGKVSRTLALRASRALQDVGAKIIGVVLNNTNRQAMSDYYDYYQDGYRYHENDAPEAGGYHGLSLK